MRIIGIDYGQARIGIAISDERRIIASPLGFVKAGKNIEASINNVLEFISDKSCEQFVVGLPLLMSGKDSEMTIEVRKFAEILEAKTGTPVKLWDERLTSTEVTRMLKEGGMSRKKRTKHVDTLSAVLILQNYLNFL